MERLSSRARVGWTFHPIGIPEKRPPANNRGFEKDRGPEPLGEQRDRGACDALLLKVNQAGTLSEALEAYRLVRSAGLVDHDLVTFPKCLGKSFPQIVVVEFATLTPECREPEADLLDVANALRRLAILREGMEALGRVGLSENTGCRQTIKDGNLHAVRPFRRYLDSAVREKHPAPNGLQRIH
jgi:hypothetical protein